MKIILLILLYAGGGAQDAPVKPEWQNYLEVEKPLFKEKKRDRRRVIDYMANFKNLTEKRIIEIRFTTEFLDNDGNVVFRTNGALKQDIKAGRSSRNKDFYSYLDNQFLSDDTYDILLPLIKSKNQPVQKVIIRSIKFDGGEQLKF